MLMCTKGLWFSTLPSGGKKNVSKLYTCLGILKNSCFLSNTDLYNHVLHKTRTQFIKDCNLLRLLEDITSWIEEVPCEAAREGLIELKKKLQGETDVF
jgi:hypothetical protein